MRQRRRFAAMLAALALAAGLTAIPALATEGGSPSTYTEIPGDGTGSVTDPLPIPDPGESAAPPSSQEPPSSSSQEPTAPPSSSSSSQEPSSSEGPSESEPTSSEDPWGGESESGGSSSEEPVIEPTEEPWQPSDSQSSDPYQGGTTTDATVPPVQEPETIATPRPAVERPEVSLNTGDDDSSAAEEDSGPNYVTFARLNVQGNSMAGTLFYSGVACIAVGVAGLVAILVLYLRGRRRYAGAEGILEEIQEAENRQQPPAPPAEALPPAPAPPPQPAPGALVPEEASLYTEEFSLPPQQPEAYEDSYQAYPEEGYVYEDQAYQEEDYGESYGQYREDYPQDVYYEDDGDAYYGTGEFEYPPQQAQEPTQAPPAQDQGGPALHRRGVPGPGRLKASRQKPLPSGRGFSRLYSTSSRKVNWPGRWERPSFKKRG